MVKSFRSLYRLKKMAISDELERDGQFVNTDRAIVIARKFLEQYHSPVIFKSAHLEIRLWSVTMEVGLLREDLIIVKIDGETGKIQGYEHFVPT